jgi:hypothetical protein
LRWLISFFLSLVFSFSLAARYFHLSQRPLNEQLLLILTPVVALGVLIYLLFPRFSVLYRQAGHKPLLLLQALLGGLLFVFSDPLPLLVRLADFLSVAGLLFALALPVASGYDYIARKEHWYSLVVSWAIGTPAAFFLGGFLSHSYPAWSAGFLSFLFLVISGTASYALIRYARAQSKLHFFPTILGLLVISLGLFFTFGLILLAIRYRTVFDPARFLLSPSAFGLFLALAMLIPVYIAWVLRFIDESGWLERWRATPLWSFLRGNLPGLVLASLFFAGYAVLSYVFNHPGLDMTENFLAADNYAWLGRLAAPTGTGIEMRAVHPFAFFIFRPLVWLFSLIFNGDRYTATLLLVPLMGGVCVFLAYLFVSRWSGSLIHALLMAALLGVSTSHILFASLVESYIFSAAALLLFFLLLLEERTRLPALVTVGVLTFGITITNFIQTFIGFLVARPRLKSIFIYGLISSALSIILTAVHAAVFPSALAFFDPAAVGVESEYSIALLGQPSWRVVGRTLLLLRNILLYSIVAPKPFVLTTEVGGVFPRFNFFKLAPGNYSFSSYEGLGSLLVLVWAILLAASGLFFLWKSLRSHRLDLTMAFPLVILFNFGLHLTYGYEPFLYSANWTYALVLFIATSLSSLAKRRWFQLGWVIFLILLVWNQWRFLQTILDAISPFFK